MIEFSYKPGWPWLLGITVGAVLLVWWSYATAIGRPKPGVRTLLFGLRLIAVAGVAGCLLDPQWVESIKHQQPARLAVLLDTSRSMSVRDMEADRMASAKAWLRDTVVPNIPANVALGYFGFDQDCASLSTGPRPGMPPFESASPTGSVTALAKALEQLLSASGSQPLLGVLVCSDGIENGGEDPLATARLYRRKGVPIHTATFGTTNEPRDIVVENVQVKRSMLNQSRNRIGVLVRSAGFAGETVPVQLRFEHQVVAQTSLTLTGGIQRAELEFAPHLKGYHVFEAAVPVQRDEWLAANNRRPFGLEIIDPTIRVLYMEGTPTQAQQPEWKYLKDALESDPNIKCKVLFRWPGTAKQGVNTVDVDPDTGETVYSVQHPTRGYPRTLMGLLEYDVVINSDILKESFSAEQLRNTARLVEEFGGGFVMVGGKKAFGAGGYHRTILDKFIPVAMENDADTANTAFQLVIAPRAWNHPLISFGATREETIQIWTRKFPTLYGFNRVGRAKPGAYTLAVDPNEQTASGPRILLAAQEVGKGRTMAFTSDTTRTWGKDFETLWGERTESGMGTRFAESNCDTQYYRRFWINAIRWLAAGKVGDTNGPVSLELAHTVARPGDSVAATIRVVNTERKPTGQASVSLTLNAPTETSRTVTAKFDAATQQYHAKLALPTAAHYTVTATANLSQIRLGQDSKLLVCEDADTEMETVRAKPELMAALAKTSGGKILSPEIKNPAAIQALYDGMAPATVELRRTPLWDRTWWLALLIGALTTEWVVRRLRGLA